MRRTGIGGVGRFAIFLAGAALAMPVSAAEGVTLIHAGRLLDRPGQAPRGPSTIVIRDAPCGAR